MSGSAFHGSSNRSRRDGYKIAFVPFRNGQPNGAPEDFATGWMLSPGRWMWRISYTSR